MGGYRAKKRKGRRQYQSGTGPPVTDREIFVGGAAGSEKTRVEIGLVGLARLSHPRPFAHLWRAAVAAAARRVVLTPPSGYSDEKVGQLGLPVRLSV